MSVGILVRDVGLSIHTGSTKMNTITAAPELAAITPIRIPNTLLTTIAVDGNVMEQDQYIRTSDETRQ